MMNLLSPKTIKFLCQEYKIRPQRKQGQNFLISGNVLNKIIEASNLKKDDIVLEIGAGFGGLTVELAGRVKKVVAVEKDKKIAKALREILKIRLGEQDYKNVEIVEEDILKIPNSQFLISKKFKVVANLPYQITTPVLRKFLEGGTKPKVMILMVQKEVGKKICASPGKMSSLSVSVQFYAQPKIVFYVSRNNFWPKPKVDSAVIKIEKIEGEKYEISEKKFFKIVKAGFSRKRKQLKNNLAGLFKEKDIGLLLEKIDLSPKIRAEELSVKDWVRLTEIIAKPGFYLKT